MSNIDILLIYINLVTELSKKTGENAIVMISDIDHLLEPSEYATLIEKLKNKISESNNYYIFTSSIDNYAYIDEDVITGINAVNDEIFEFPSLERIKEFVENNYPCNIKLDECEFIKMLEGTVNNVGLESYVDIQSVIISKLINRTIGLSNKKYNINQEEYSFLKA